MEMLHCTSFVSSVLFKFLVLQLFVACLATKLPASVGSTSHSLDGLATEVVFGPPCANSSAFATWIGWAIILLLGGLRFRTFVLDTKTSDCRGGAVAFGDHTSGPVSETMTTTNNNNNNNQKLPLGNSTNVENPKRSSQQRFNVQAKKYRSVLGYKSQGNCEGGLLQHRNCILKSLPIRSALHCIATKLKLYRIGSTICNLVDAVNNEVLLRFKDNQNRMSLIRPPNQRLHRSLQRGNIRSGHTGAFLSTSTKYDNQCLQSTKWRRNGIHKRADELPPSSMPAHDFIPQIGIAVKKTRVRRLSRLLQWVSILHPTIPGIICRLVSLPKTLYASVSSMFTGRASELVRHNAAQIVHFIAKCCPAAVNSTSLAKGSREEVSARVSAMHSPVNARKRAQKWQCDRTVIAGPRTLPKSVRRGQAAPSRITYQEQHSKNPASVQHNFTFVNVNVNNRGCGSMSGPSDESEWSTVCRKRSKVDSTTVRSSKPSQFTGTYRQQNIPPNGNLRGGPMRLSKGSTPRLSVRSKRFTNSERNTGLTRPLCTVLSSNGLYGQGRERRTDGHKLVGCAIKRRYSDADKVVQDHKLPPQLMAVVAGPWSVPSYDVSTKVGNPVSVLATVTSRPIRADGVKSLFLNSHTETFSVPPALYQSDEDWNLAESVNEFNEHESASYINTMSTAYTSNLESLDSRDDILRLLDESSLLDFGGSADNGPSKSSQERSRESQDFARIVNQNAYPYPCALTTEEDYATTAIRSPPQLPDDFGMCRDKLHLSKSDVFLQSQLVPEVPVRFAEVLSQLPSICFHSQRTEQCLNVSRERSDSDYGDMTFPPGLTRPFQWSCQYASKPPLMSRPMECGKMLVPTEDDWDVPFVHCRNDLLPLSLN